MSQSIRVMLWLIACAPVAGGGETRRVADFDSTWRDGRWTFSNGSEFPGARGQFARAKSAAHKGQWGGRLGFDFSGGGNYVAAILRLDRAPDVAAVRVWVRKPRGHRLTFRYTDQSGQTLQKGFLARDEQWTDAFIHVDGLVGRRQRWPRPWPASADRHSAREHCWAAGRAALR